MILIDILRVGIAKKTLNAWYLAEIFNAEIITDSTQGRKLRLESVWKMKEKITIIETKLMVNDVLFNAY